MRFFIITLLQICYGHWKYFENWSCFWNTVHIGLLQLQ